MIATLGQSKAKEYFKLRGHLQFLTAGARSGHGLCTQMFMLRQHQQFLIRPAPLQREAVLKWIAGGLILGLVLLLVLRAVWREPMGVSSFGALADAFLKGRLFVDACPEIDCAFFDGRTYIIFPPLPAVLLVPVVAVTGLPAFKGAIAIGAVLVGLALLVWRRIFDALELDRACANWLIAAIAFSSPLFYVVMKSNSAWFFAQSVGFLMASLAIASVILWRNLILACFFVGMGFLCRQMLIFYPLFLLALAMAPDERMLRPSIARLRSLAVAALPLIAALALAFLYNHARFGNPFDTGYGHISNPGSTDYITRRLQDYGLFSAYYVLFNFYHLFVQGFHAEFDPIHRVTLTGIDMNGTALLVACPWLALAFYMRLDRVAAVGLVVIGVIAGITLFYHSNGYAQIGAMRYALDWLPIVFVLLARSVRPEAFRALPLLATVAIAMNAMWLATSIAATAR